MQYRKFHFILAAILVTSAAIAFFALRSQGTTAKRIFFSQNLANASSESKPLDQVIASAMLENAAEPSQSLTILDSIAGVQREVKILAEQLTYSPQTRIIDYELAIDQPCHVPNAIGTGVFKRLRLFLLAFPSVVVLTKGRVDSPFFYPVDVSKRSSALDAGANGR